MSTPSEDDTGSYRRLLELQLRDFRNIASASLAFGPGLNLISGANASGKTSLLEAIYCLGRVKSFRTRTTEFAIRHGQSFYRIFGQVQNQHGSRTPVGIERHVDAVTVHLDRQPLRRLSELAGCLPVQVLSADMPTIFNGGPRQRRHTLDWALFHVEHDYRELMQRYGRILKQRNAALRSRAPDTVIASWNVELVDLANRIDHMRIAYLGEFTPLLVSELKDLLPGREIELRYLKGWPVHSTLAESLIQGLGRDRQYSVTQYGIHRADFQILVDSGDVLATCSRGQQKNLLVAFLLAQLRMQRLRRRPVGAFLLDDLGSELDMENRTRVLSAMRELSAQLFVTTIDDDPVDLRDWGNMRRFHVEHGSIEEVL